jgi:hypothetical protein
MMPPTDCSLDELKAQLVALESRFTGFKELMEERDRRYAQRAASQDDAVAKALETSKEAVTKAESATERRLETLNELRGVVVDQARDFARKAEVQLLVDGIEKRVEGISKAVTEMAAHGGGIRDALGWLVGIAGLVIAAITAWFSRHS